MTSVDIDDGIGIRYFDGCDGVSSLQAQAIPKGTRHLIDNTSRVFVIRALCLGHPGQIASGH